MSLLGLAASAWLMTAAIHAPPSRPEPEQLSVQAFGARGDGVQDDTSALQAAIEACPPGGTLLLPAGGRYAIHDPLVISRPLRLLGHGAEIRAARKGLEVLIRIQGVRGLSIEGLRLNSDRNGRTCLDLLECADFRIERCYFTGYTAEYGHYKTDSGIRLSQSSQGTIKRCTWKDFGNQYGTRTSTLNRAITLNDPQTDHITIEENAFDGVNQGIVIAGGRNNAVINNHFQGVRDNCLYVLGKVKGVSIRDNTMIRGHDEALVISGENVTITGNKVLDFPNKFIAFGGNLTNLLIEDNQFENTTTDTGQFIASRSPMHLLKGCTVRRNQFIARSNRTSFDYFAFTGPVSGLSMIGNRIQVPTLPFQKILAFRGAPTTGIVADNRIQGSNPVAVALTLAKAHPGHHLVVRDNEIAGCRIIPRNLQFPSVEP